jgi:TRAP-type mannitol/chloroaromatic compound transport system substrate-binding protein
MWGDVLVSLGATVTNIAVNELYSSMEKGIIDAFEYMGPYANYENGYHEIAKYLGVPGIHSTSTIEFLLCNNDIWAKLPADLQQLLYDTMKSVAAVSLYEFVIADAEALDNFKNKTKVEFVRLSDETQKQIIEYSLPFHKKWMEEDPTYKSLWESQKEYVRKKRLQETELQTPYTVYEFLD